MNNFTKVLFATDFSPGSKLAMKVLLKIRDSYGSVIDFIHVIPSIWKDWFSSSAYKEQALQRLHSWQIELCENSELKNLHVLHGNPAEMILEESNKTQADLIVLGGGVAVNPGRYSSKATARAVVRHANSSVLVCKNSTISRILCGVDGSDQSAKALNYALDICRHFSASLCVVFVIPRSDFNPLGLSNQEIAAYEEKFRIDKIEKINRFLEAFDFSKTPVEKHFLLGKPGDVILDRAEDEAHDLIVIGAKGQSILHRLLIGSTAEKILCYSPCSLLVVR